LTNKKFADGSRLVTDSEDPAKCGRIVLKICKDGGQGQSGQDIKLFQVP